jgi:hypothetical protein
MGDVRRRLLNAVLSQPLDDRVYTGIGAAASAQVFGQEIPLA